MSQELWTYRTMAFCVRSGTMNAETDMRHNSFMSAAAIFLLLVTGNIFAADAALTTGKTLPAEADQKKFGGDPDECYVYDMYTFYVTDYGRNIFNMCKTGKLLCTQCKPHCIEELSKYQEARHRKEGLR